MTKTNESAAKNETKPAALTEEQRKAKRNEYARAYYAAHRDACKAAVKRCNEKKRAAGKKPASKGRAHHAICQDKPVSKKHAKKVLKPTPGQKYLAKLEKLLTKSQVKQQELKTKLDKQTAEIKQLKAEIKKTKVLVRAVNSANAAVRT